MSEAAPDVHPGLRKEYRASPSHRFDVDYEMADTSTKNVRPLWREPIMLGIVALVALLCTVIWFQDRIVHRNDPAIDPNNKAAQAAGGAGGGFCDLPVPVKSTPVDPTSKPSW
jgi:hypothetical protein